MEVDEVMNMQPWKESKLVAKLLKDEETKFNKYTKFLLRSFNAIQANKKYETLQDALGVNSNEILLAVFIQNGRQEKNSRRVEAIQSTNGEFINFIKGEALEEQASHYIKEILKDFMLIRLRTAEK
jgi:hypothetical protein